ncbi:hypothetical protein KM031_05450 [Gemmobacter fulvus]|uniref:Uncharacterized protein n=1 Tax=Gemmobacter fulvus TaxID=2840474 RepID=A0A975P7Z9_9RHOB|nr:hypothetical protein [Gemmobacter fulvus]MBT9244462.1 hypothetical protein [Gemmobacter fulvus]QWK91334.1 hypothetical protein KM031_05450 [Gemmobacter fulvus]
MKKERRWLKSVLAASETVEVRLPWQRSARSKPEAVTSQAAPKALAAR